MASLPRQVSAWDLTMSDEELVWLKAHGIDWNA
jgi:hypothetical protein